MNETYSIGKVRISRTTPYLLCTQVAALVASGRPSYVCVSNVRTVALGNQDENYRQVMHEAALCIPDGMPLVWMARLWGLKDVQRSTGPDLFVRMLSDSQSGLRHFLLGDTEETLAAIRAKYPDANICGTLSPPFCEVDDFNYEGIARIVNQSGADIIWVSLRSPKQDFFAARLLPFLNRGICIGVGAAFRFAVGRIKHPPEYIKTLGLTGLFWRKIDIRKVGWYIHHFFLLCKWGSGIFLTKFTKGCSKT